MAHGKSEGETEVNLFGDPVESPHKGRGRPSFEWTVERSNKVLLAFAAGRSKRDAAIAVGCSVRTLDKVFLRELEWRRDAAIRFEAVQLHRLNEQAKAGNVGAEKELRKMLESARREATAEAYRAPPKPPAAEARPGKKKQRALDAVSAHEGSTWGDLVRGAAGPH